MKSKAPETKNTDKYFFHIFLLIFLPAASVIFFLMFNMISNNSKSLQYIKNNYDAKLESICSKNETTVSNIISTVEIFLVNEIFTTETAVSHTDVSPHILDTLSKIKQSDILIDSIILFDRGNNTVYSDSGSYNSIIYYNNIYSYSNYNKIFWEEYSDQTGEARILYPSFVTTYDTSKTVLPIVFANEKLGTDRIIVTNIDLTKIVCDANASKLTDNSVLAIINKSNKNIFLENYDSPFIPDKSFFYNIQGNSAASFFCNVNDRKSLIVSYPSDKILNGYSYFAVIPYRDITTYTPSAIITAVIYIIAAVAALMLLVYFSSKQIYKPIENIFDIFKNHNYTNVDKQNSIQSLQTNICNILDTIHALSTKNAKLNSIAQDAHLINMLNSNIHYNFPDNYLENIGVSFKQKYFCSIIIKFIPTEKFYSTYSIIEYDIIKTGIFDIIKNSFEEHYDVHLIPSETDTSYVLLNLPDASQEDNISYILAEIQNATSYDKDYLTLKTAMGGIYAGINGLRKSHMNAVNAISDLPEFNYVKTGSKNTVSKNYMLSISDENAIFNKLMLGDFKGTTNFINGILNKNIGDGASEASIIQVQIQILTIVFKVIRTKNIDENLSDAYDFSIMTKLMQQSIPENQELILHYIDTISNINSYSQKKYSKVDIQTITSYIDNNFRQDLCLETVSDVFGIKPKYLSKLFAENLGTNFTAYLATLRINFAKTLLIETDKNINDIYTAVGFNNRNTFLRTFKKITGYTPSEFRNQNMNIQQKTSNTV